MKLWRKALRLGLICVFAVYTLVLVKIVMLKAGASSELRRIQLVPFAFVGDLFAADASIDVFLKNVLGNFAIFMPLGILLPLFFRKLSLARTILAGFLVSLAFEIAQFAMGLGLTDVDDLMLNTLGAAAGAALYFKLFRKSGDAARTEIISFAFLTVFGLCGALSLWLYSPSILPAQIEFVNEAALGGVASDSYDISAVCVGLADGEVRLREGSARLSSEGTPPDPRAEFALSEDAVLIIERKSYQYSPNGNIQKTTVTYGAADESEAASVVASCESCFIDIWLNDAGQCDMLILSVFEN